VGTGDCRKFCSHGEKTWIGTLECWIGSHLMKETLGTSSGSVWSATTASLASHSVESGRLGKQDTAIPVREQCDLFRVARHKYVSTVTSLQSHPG
jgi:hypothetical protein